MSTEDISDVIIVGSGPAGLTAAIYTARANLSPKIIEGEPSSNSDQPGGQLMLTTEVENFPGFPDGILGPELMNKMRDQAIKFGAEFITKKVTKVELSGKIKRVWLSDAENTELKAHSVIVATGAKSLMLDIEGESRLLGYGVSTCATCDGFFFRNKLVGVVGGGDSALEEAIFLTKFATKVYIIHRRDSFRASKIMQKRAENHEKIEILWNTEVKRVNGDTNLDSVLLYNNALNKEYEFELNGLFVAIGHSPNTEIFKGQILMDENGYITTTNGTKTNLDGVFACGDVQDHIYKQAITAAGSGCAAAIDAEKWLNSNFS
jgi:thioredoxin reductase (NADPH)